MSSAVARVAPMTADPRLSHLFRPRSVAVVGASANPARVGARVIRFLEAGGYTGAIYPVNPGRDEVLGRRCWRSLEELPEPPDVSVLAVRADQTAEALEAVARAGGKAAIAMAAGFREGGGPGIALERELAAVADRTGVRLLGPNSVGFRNPGSGTVVTFASDVEFGSLDGSVAIVSQSGGLAGYFGAAVLKSRGTGYRWIIDTGNEIDIDIADCIAYLSADEEVSVIALITEGCRDGDRLRSALETARLANKPVVTLKLGGSQAGAKSAASHTGALAGDDKIYDAVFREHGVHRVADEHELLETLALYDAGAVPAGRNVAVFSLSGGVATLLADACERRGLCIPEIEAPPNPAVREALPSSRFDNPLDLSGQIGAEPQLLREVLDHVVSRPQIDSVILGFAYMLQSPRIAEVFVPAVIEAARLHGKPMVVAGLATPEAREQLREHGVLVEPMPVDAVNALAATARCHTPASASPSSPPPRNGPEPDVRRTITGPAATALLSGVPFVESVDVHSADEAVAAAERFGFPVVVKGESDQITHKTELGLVRVALADARSVAEAYEHVAGTLAEAADEGTVVVQRQVAGVEMVLGVRNDPTFGPVVMVGTGGIFVEVLNDVAFGIPPLSRESARALIDGLRGAKLLGGARGEPPAAVEDLVDTLVTLGDIALAERATISEVDINPFVVGRVPGSSRAVDAVVVTSRTRS